MKNYTKNLGTDRTMNTIKSYVKLLDKRMVAIEIGCFEGQTTQAILDFMSKDSIIICIDPFLDKYLPENTPFDKSWEYFSGQRERFIENMKDYLDKIILKEGFSSDILPTLDQWNNKVDFIFIDGDHRAESVYNDAKLSFPLIKSGGIIIFDDYGWGRNLSKEYHTHIGVDKFINEFNSQIKVLKKDSQVVIFKI